MDPTNSLVRAEEQKNTIQTSHQTFGGLVPRNLDELWRVATWISKSGMAPKGLQTPEAISVAIQMGLEVGMKVMQSVQNIAVINGRPSIWGDAALALCRASGELEKFREWFTGEKYTDQWTAHCLVKRKGDEEDDVAEVSFSYADAKHAKLIPAHPDSPWTKYPGRMLQMRARSWPLRDKFTDVLKGLQVAEESSDVVVMTETSSGSFVPEPEKVSGKEALKAKLKKKPTEQPITEEPTIPEPVVLEQISPETYEDASKIDDPKLPPEDTAKTKQVQPEQSLEPKQAKAAPTQAPPRLDEIAEYELFNEFKNLKTTGFVEWLQKNIATRGAWTLFISRAVDTKCKNLFSKTLDEVLPELESMNAPSSTTPPEEEPTPKTLEGKIIRIEDLLHRKYAHIGATTRQDWMQASWDCDLEGLRDKITDKIADTILDDLSDPIRSTLTSFART